MTTVDTDDDPMFWARLEHIIRAAVDGLDPVDRDERVAYCRRTGQHGVTAFAVADGLELHWGGRPLALVDRGVFGDDAYLEPMSTTFLPDAPDDAAGLSDR